MKKGTSNQVLSGGATDTHLQNKADAERANLFGAVRALDHAQDDLAHFEEDEILCKAF